MVHKPVLLGEVIKNLNLKPGMTVVDGTLGAGGHSAAILEKIIPGGRLISIDWDERAIWNFENKIAKGLYIAKRKLIGSAVPVPVNMKNKNDDRVFSHYIKLGNREGKIVGHWHGTADNYANIKRIIRGLGVKTADAVFVDLGFSSDQIEDHKRGFSFLQNGPLDMRYSPETQSNTAAAIVNSYSEDELARIFREFGEERFAGRIAREILLRRPALRRRLRQGEGSQEQVRTTRDLVEIVAKAVPEKYKRGKIHFATRVFQALRIETNQELENLKKFLEQSLEILANEGRLAIISFHSLEDRIVKNFFREQSRGCVCPPNFPKCICGHQAKIKVVTKKPISANREEIRANPRARSAKLRVAQKI